MIGQNIRNARRVVVMIEDADGRQHGWMIHDPARVEWHVTGVIGGNQGTQATITASGTFQRMSKSDQSREVERKMNHAALHDIGVDERGELT